MPVVSNKLSINLQEVTLNKLTKKFFGFTHHRFLPAILYIMFQLFVKF